MVRTLSLTMAAIVLIGGLSQAFCEGPPGEVVEVTMTGQGEKEEDAFRDAQRKAIEKVCVVVYGETEVKNNIATKDVILARSVGWLQDSTVTAKKTQADGSYLVTIKAKVAKGDLTDVWGAVKQWFMANGQPSLCVIARERGVPNKEASTVDTTLSGYLLKDGFLVKDSSTMDGIIKKDMDAALAKNDPDLWMALQRKTKAHLYVVIDAAVDDAAEQAGGLFTATASCEAKVIEADNGRVIASVSCPAQEGVGKSFAAARIQSLQFCAAYLRMRLVRSILETYNDIIWGPIGLEIKGVEFGDTVKIEQAVKAIAGVKQFDSTFDAPLMTGSVMTRLVTKDFAKMLNAKLGSRMKIKGVSWRGVVAEWITAAEVE